MVLVIGIILGAFVAMILIVIFVLKKRIRVDGNGTVKGDEGLAGSSGPPGAAPGGPPGINHGPPGGAAPRYQVLFIHTGSGFFLCVLRETRFYQKA